MREKPVRLGLLGQPLGHTLSPYLQERLLKDNGLSGVYLPFEVAGNDLKKALDGLKVLGFTGVNVTIPHKRTVFSYLDETTEDAELVQAVNTITVKGDRLFGANTDIKGFELALDKNSVKVQACQAVLLGCGGAARAVAYSLIRSGVAKIRIFNRNSETARELSRELAQSTGFSEVHVGDWTEAAISAAAGTSELLINSTPVGMWPNLSASPYTLKLRKDDLTVIDLVYNPVTTQFLVEAAAAGAKVVSGLDMFIYQGFESLKIWLDRESLALDFKNMKEHLMKRLKKR